MVSTVRRLLFSLRKLNHPISRNALVLEVGSGDSPCPRSDVLFDMTLENSQRVGGVTVHDRPLVLGSAERLPFADKSFDYVLAYHVLEHVSDPDSFLKELQRVGKAGYIETPSYWAERMIPLTMHKLEVGLVQENDHPKLIINKKQKPITDHRLSDQFRPVIEKKMGLPHLNPNAWVTRYWWNDTISYEIINPEESANWSPPPDVVRDPNYNPRSLVRRLTTKVLSALYPRKKISIEELIRCPHCKSRMTTQAGSLSCYSCKKQYSVESGIPRLF